MILADTIKNLALSAGYSVTRTQALLGVTGTVLLPLCLLKNLASLAPFSLVGIIGMLYTTAAMGLRWYQKSYSPGGAFFATQLAEPVFGSAGAAAAFTNPATLILACMLSNAYIAHFNAPKFLKELKNNTLPRFYQVIAWSFGTAIGLYGLITAFGFLTFGAYRSCSHPVEQRTRRSRRMALSLMATHTTTHICRLFCLRLPQVEPRMV
jgi:amino acid permease